MIEIIPAIDIIEGKCVRLTQGDYEKKTIYNEDPLEVARMFEDHGIRRLHLVDLDGAKAHHIVNYKVLEKLASRTSLIIDFGGGLKSEGDLEIAFESGAQMVTGGSIAVTNRDMFLNWLKKYGPERIILGADVKDHKIAINGWKEEAQVDLLPFVSEYKSQGVEKVITTDIGKDGMMGGPATALYTEMLSSLPGLYLIASGGVSHIRDIEKLESAGIPAVIVGKAIYEGCIKLPELTPFL